MIAKTAPDDKESINVAHVIDIWYQKQRLTENYWTWTCIHKYMWCLHAIQLRHTEHILCPECIPELSAANQSKTPPAIHSQSPSTENKWVGWDDKLVLDELTSNNQRKRKIAGLLHSHSEGKLQQEAGGLRAELPGKSLNPFFPDDGFRIWEESKGLRMKEMGQMRKEQARKHRDNREGLSLDGKKKNREELEPYFLVFGRMEPFVQVLQQ